MKKILLSTITLLLSAFALVLIFSHSLQVNAIEINKLDSIMNTFYLKMEVDFPELEDRINRIDTLINKVNSLLVNNNSNNTNTLSLLKNNLVEKRKVYLAQKKVVVVSKELIAIGNKIKWNNPNNNLCLIGIGGGGGNTTIKKTSSDYFDTTSYLTEGINRICVYGGKSTPSVSCVFIDNITNSINYTVTFNGNSGTGHTPATKSFTENTAVGTLPTNPTRAGFTFNGWFTAASGGTAITTSTIINANVTFYAQWTANVTVVNYTVTFDGNGGTGHTPTTKSVVNNTAIGTLPTNPTRVGFTFNGWFTAASGGTLITTGTIVTANTTYYAQWTAVVTNYTVTFNGNGGGGYMPLTKSVTENTAVGTLPINPTRAGYTFNGWFTAASGGTLITTGTIITANVTFYAQWTAVIINYTVTFDGNGGTGHTPITKSVTENTTVGTLPTNPTKSGFKFNGWLAVSGGTPITTSTIITANVTYYAQWIAAFTVTANGNIISWSGISASSYTVSVYNNGYVIAGVTTHSTSIDITQYLGQGSNQICVYPSQGIEDGCVFITK